MSMKEQVSANRNSIAIAVAVVLCGLALAYNNGWFSPSPPSPAPESNKISAAQTMQQDKPKQDTEKVTLKTTKPAGQTTE
jgi:hypothetical protein